MTSLRPRKYCCVFGCMNATTEKPELSFFKLPNDVQRHSDWLHLISREDLINKPAKSYTVCEEHFNSNEILPGKQRKLLKRNSKPSLKLPNLQKSDEATLSEVLKQIEKSTQTSSNDCTLSESLSIRKTKLISELTVSQKKMKVREIENKMQKYQRDLFHKLCDRFLTKEFAELAKAQTYL